jgi:hypothetical protein
LLKFMWPCNSIYFCCEDIFIHYTESLLGTHRTGCFKWISGPLGILNVFEEDICVGWGSFVTKFIFATFTFHVAHSKCSFQTWVEIMLNLYYIMKPHGYSMQA